MNGEKAMLRRILVGLDGSPLAETILDVVRALARRLGAEVVLLHVTHVPEMVRAAEPNSVLDGVMEQERVRGQTYLDAAAGRIAGSGLVVQTAVCVGDAATEIVRYAERERIDLIALATHGRSGMQRWLYGSVADAVLHATTTPLLLLRPTTDGAIAAPEVRRIVVPLDGSPLAEGALSTAVELARALGAPVVLVRVVEFIGLAFSADPFGSPYLDCQQLLDVLRQDAEQYLRRLAADLRGKGLTVETRAPIGIAVETITALAREQPGSVIVLSTHGRSGWRARMLGSVARRVVLLASRPVLVTRPAEARTQASGSTGP
jgi:nucleotide-binding universal stress UspA family protein